MFRRNRILGTAYRASDRCRGRWDRAGRHLVGRRDKRKSTVSEGKKNRMGQPSCWSEVSCFGGTADET